MVNKKRIFKPTTIILLIALICIYFSPSLSVAAEPLRSRIIVSMGDSYSSGEGVAPFWDDYDKYMETYTDDRTYAEKVTDKNWLAHRSIWAWSGQLALPETGIVNITKHNEDPNWFFVASSGAETKHIFKESQPKTYSKEDLKGTVKLQPQIDILRDMKTMQVTPDYVTITIGGNDAEFEKIVKTAVASHMFHIPGLVQRKLNNVWDRFYEEKGIRDCLKDVYNEISRYTGKKTCILVGGYPQLFSPDGGGVIRPKDAKDINTSVSNFNIEIKKLVVECQKTMNIDFVTVETAFENHGAYSDSPYINPIMSVQPDDLNDSDWFSSFSIHPNILGINAYRDCFQNKINEKEGLSDDWIDSVIPTPTPTSTPTPILTPTSTPILTPTPTPGIDMDMKVVYSPYTDVLRDYESEMRTIENSEWGATDTCALTDVTGDGYPELIILYVAEGEYGSDNWFSADVCVYTVFPGETSATNILHLPEITHFTSAGMACSDVVLLSNGNILVETADGDEDWFVSYFEYAFDGHSYNLICTTEDNYYAYSHEDYLINGESVSEETFNKKIEEYKSMFTSVLAMNPFYNYDYASDWAIAVLDTPNNIMSFDEAWELLSSSESTESVLDEASVNLGVYNYISSWYDWDTAYAREEEYGSDAAGWGPDTSYVDGMYVTAFQSYTGAVLYYYTDPLTGYTYETEYGAFNGYEETKTGVDFYIQDYLV